MSQQDRAHRLPFTNEEREQYRLTLESRAYGQLKFRTVHNVGVVVEKEETARRVVEQCNLTKYLEKFSQEADHVKCVEFL